MLETPLCPTLGHTVPGLVGDSRRTGFSPQLSKGTQNLLPCFLWAPKSTGHPNSGDSHLGEGSILVAWASFVPATVSGQRQVLDSEQQSACLEESP